MKKKTTQDFGGVSAQLMFMTRDMTNEEFNNAMVMLCVETELMRERMLRVAAMFDSKPRNPKAKKK